MIKVKRGNSSKKKNLNDYARLQTLLSKERTLLSEERTVLAEITVFIAVIVLGFALMGFFEDSAFQFIVYLGIAIIVVGAVGIAWAMVVYKRYGKRLEGIEKKSRI